MLHHIFQAEDWHAQRLLGQTPQLDETIDENDAARLFAYGEIVREQLTCYLCPPAEARAPVSNQRQQDPVFLVIHEIRHPAQVATAVRNAGLEPPGRHDLFFCDALQ
jgi:hypothetical protein